MPLFDERKFGIMGQVIREDADSEALVKFSLSRTPDNNNYDDLIACEDGDPSTCFMMTTVEKAIEDTVPTMTTEIPKTHCDSCQATCRGNITKISLL